MLAGFPLLVPPLALAQSASRMRRVGWLLVGFGSSPREDLQDALAALAARGWSEGKSVTYEFRRAHASETGAFDQYARELVRLDSDVLITLGEPSTEAAMRATSTIPIVFFAAGDPVARGWVASLNRPTGNVTGFSTLADEQQVKRIEALRELVPRLRTIAILIYGPRSGDQLKREASTKQRYARDGISIVYVYAGSEADTDAAIADAARQGADAILAAATQYSNASDIAASAIRHRLPLYGVDPKLVEAGALMSLSNDRSEQLEMVADLVDRILRGTKPADLPVRRATKFEIVVNRSTARALGLRIPQSLLVRARIVA
ncbi:MAG: ABC transporter substrate-binding protein [Burkholderiales bacterium]